MNLSTSSLSYDWFVFALRIAFIGLILLFLYQVTRVTLAELVRIGIAAQAPQSSAGAGSYPIVPHLDIVNPANTGLAPGERYVVDPFTTIGRRADNSIVLADAVVSSVHAQIVYDGGQWWAQDLDSTNGTRVNGQEIDDPVQLHIGDTVQFGSVVTRFVA